MKASTKKYAMWGVALLGGWWIWKKMRSAPKFPVIRGVSGLGGAFPDRERLMYPPGSGSTF